MTSIIIIKIFKYYLKLKLSLIKNLGSNISRNLGYTAVGDWCIF